MLNNEIILIVGRSGSGKSAAAKELEKLYGWKILQSYTTRPPRYEGEDGHEFVNKAEFDNLQNKCAYTEFAGYEYCATDEQIEKADIYIIDPAGIEFFLRHYHGSKTPICFLIDVSTKESLRRMMNRKGSTWEECKRRIDNDEKVFGDIKDTLSILNLQSFIIDDESLMPQDIALEIKRLVDEL